MHPLANLSMREAFPTIGCFLCCFNKSKISDDEKEKYREALRERDAKLNAVIEDLDGKYKGRNFLRSAAKEHNMSASSSNKGSDDNDDGYKAEDANTHPDHDPLDQFGFGISAWMSQLRFLFKLFL